MDILALLTQQHRQIEQHFADADYDAIVSGLRDHDRIEREFLYPVCRDAGLDPSLIDHAEQEHLYVSQLVGRLAAGEISVLGALQTNVEEHVREEETELFNQVRSKISPDQLAELGRSAVR